MAAGWWKKIKDGVSNIIHKAKPTLGKVVNTVGNIVEKAKPIVGVLKPFIPGNIGNAIDKGLEYADKGLGIGESLMNRI